jgi:tol-pal system protein YbgF
MRINGDIAKLLLVGLLLLAGCSAATPGKGEADTTTYREQIKSNTESIEALKEQNKNLKEINTSLKLEVNEFRKRITILKKKQSEQLENMDHTVSLLELNIKDLQRQYVGGLRKGAISSSKKRRGVQVDTKSKKISDDLGSLVQQSAGIELRTPANSKAVENFSLNSKPTKKGVSTTPKKTKNVLVAGGKKTDEIETAWEDEDLQAPKSPIFLEVYPGAKNHYNNAFKSYTLKDYTKAIELFEEFLVRYPNDQYADNAQFWIGKAHFDLKDYQQSEHAFRKVLRNYEHGKTREGFKTPDSILMLGRLSLIRGKPIKARKYFEHVVKQYPNSRSADKATKEIQSLKSL